MFFVCLSYVFARKTISLYKIICIDIISLISIKTFQSFYVVFGNSMKNIVNDTWESDKKNTVEVINNEISSSEKPINASSTSKALADISTSSKKDLSYIFKRDATKKKLEAIEKKLVKLQQKSIDKENTINEKREVLSIFLNQYYTLDLEHNELFTAFQLNLTLNWIKDLQILSNPQARENFLLQYTATLRKQFSQTLSAEQKNQMKTLIEQEVKKEDENLTNLYISLLNVQAKKSVLDDRKKDIDLIKQEIKILQKEFADHQELIDKTNEEFFDEDKRGLLKSYESSDPKVSIKDFVGSQQIENQLKKLIDMYNNPTEAKKFGLVPPKGILFVGEQETWKTFAARVLASEIDRKMYHIKAHDLFSENVNNPNEMLYNIFYDITNHVQKTKESCVIFLDEIEQIITSLWEYNPAEQKIISNTIIKNIINIQKSDLDIVIVAGLSERNKIDERFMKYHTFDNQFFFELPKAEERKRLFQLYISKAEKRAKVKLFDSNPEVFQKLVDKTEWFSAEYIKQLVNSCVKEYAYNFIQKKTSFAIDEEFISLVAKKIDKHIKNISSQESISSEKRKVLSLADRQKILNALITKYTMKDLIFGEVTPQKKDDLLQCMLKNTKWYTESDINQCFVLFAEEYQRRNISYHRQFLIQEDFVLDIIAELRQEDKIKWKGAYFSNK